MWSLRLTSIKTFLLDYMDAMICVEFEIYED